MTGRDPARPSDPSTLGLALDEAELARSLFDELFQQLARIGLADDGSVTRLALTDRAAEADRWFDATALNLGLAPTVDRNGNRWAWTEAVRPRSIATGSHLDTVPRGGRFDGALGVVGGFIAAHIVNRRGGARSPLAVVSFADEEGGRFNTPTFGSRLTVGALDPDTVLDRIDRSGDTLGESLARAGIAVDGLGRDDATLDQIAAFVELHIEQGLHLEERKQPIGIATSILPHGRWRIELHGEANHGGTTAMASRRDPMLPLAELLRAGRTVAEAERALVTIGKVEIWPNSTNSIPERVSAWMDVRSENESQLDQIVHKVAAVASEAAAGHGIDLTVECESRIGAVRFSGELRECIGGVLEGIGLEAVEMATGAGHDAGVLASQIPTAMLFVRNVTGVSHSPAENARTEDCLAGIAALIAVLDDFSKSEGGSELAAPFRVTARDPWHGS